MNSVFPAAPSEPEGSSDALNKLFAVNAAPTDAAKATEALHQTSCLPDVVSGSNPLVTAANPLLNVFPQIRAMDVETPITDMHQLLHGGIQTFETQASAAGVNAATIKDMSYCLCTVLDEAAARTPWGGSAWAKHSLLVGFHKDAKGGEVFFQVLTRLLQAPSSNIDAIELLYFCLMLGFEGRFMVRTNGRAELEDIKAQLLQVIENTRGSRSAALSAQWQGVARKATQPWTLLSLWLASAVSVLLAFGIYMWFSHRLAVSSDELFANIQHIRFPKLAIAEPVQLPTPPPVVEPRLQPFLQAEIKQGLVEVKDEADRSTVLLHGDGLFAPGSSAINPTYVRLIERLAQALNDVPGKVQVNGYTDNIAIRTARFPSNWHLSQERAESVLERLAQVVRDKGRLQAQGQGESNPIAANTTVQGRARNRRVEIVLLVAPRQQTSSAPRATPAQPN